MKSWKRCIDAFANTNNKQVSNKVYVPYRRCDFSRTRSCAQFLNATIGFHHLLIFCTMVEWDGSVLTIPINNRKITGNVI